ncbi:MAG TPA: permease-like cell division protein FtsX [Burkholderiales bacterium]|nr:permease-like cell division protein FtsX [Burkholderiales bacterium]
MKAWLRLHGMAFGATLARLARTPFATLLNVLVIGIALALPAGAYALLVNLQQAARGISGDPELSVFMALDAKKDEVAAIGPRLKAEALVARVDFKPREAALDELKKNPAMGDVLVALNQNPLPDAYVVRLSVNDGDALEKLAAGIRSWPKVETVQIDSAWVRRVAAAIDLGRMGVLVLAGLLSFALLAVTFNTIRLQILTQREEIEVSKLLGATDSTIRRPFYYYGALLGLLGGGAAGLIVYAALQFMNRGVAEFSKLYASDFRLEFLPAGDLGAILAFAAILGWMGAWLSVTRHLREFEPH